MKLERLYDVQLCQAVVHELWDDVSEDGAKQPFWPDVVNEFWIGIFEDRLSGIYRIHAINGVTWQIHALMVDRTNSKESGKRILEWFYNEDIGHKLIAEIPVIYEHVYHFTKKQGFKDEGVNRKSFMKNGELVDTYRLGITREEICQQLSQQ